MKDNDPAAVRGMIFNVQHYCIHDGPGIRTTVFMKGCPLRCLWCQNPESHSIRPQLFFAAGKCSGCGRCAETCPHKAVTLREGKAVTNRKLCKACGACVAECLQGARIIMGTEVTAGEVWQKIAQDKIFYDDSGGATLSGGEPLFQPEFSLAILKLCKDDGIHTALETCGYAPWETIEEILPYVDLFLYDLKHMDDDKHKRFTGVSNEVIKQNLIKIFRRFKPLIVRVPVIPGYNDSKENMEALAKFVIDELDSSIPVNLLPYHRLGDSKWAGLESAESSFKSNPPAEEQMEALKQMFFSFGLSAQIGG